MNFVILIGLMVLTSSIASADVEVQNCPNCEPRQFGGPGYYPYNNSPPVSVPSGPPLKCPEDQTGDSIDSYRKKAVKKLVSGDYNGVHTSLKECFSTETPKCLDALKEQLEIQRNPTGRYSMMRREEMAELSQYFGSQGGQNAPVIPSEGLTLKSEKDLPPEFLAKGADGKVKPGYVNFPPEILKLAKTKGWKAIGYKTRSTGGFDNPPNLSLVAIPGKDKDIYLQISPHPDPDSAATKDNPYPVSKDFSTGQHVLTVITADKTKTPPTGQLRLLRYDDIAKAYKWSNSTSVSSCIQCHTTPLRSISPRGYKTTNGTEKRMKPEDEKTVSEINEMMIVPGLSWGHLAGEDGKKIARGPLPSSQPYGWAPPGGKTREMEFIQRCSESQRSQSFQSLDSNYTQTFQMDPNSHINHEKVGTAMDCVQCHNNTTRGFLHDNFSFAEIKFKILVDRSMPPGRDLSNNERIALVNCLRAEFQENREVWQKGGSWMKAEECTDTSKATGQNRGTGGNSKTSTAPATK